MHVDGDAKLVKSVEMKLPRHVAIVMDGNGRWAEKRGLTRLQGHKKGATTAREIVEYCGRLGIEYLTLFAFSSENWGRPKDEISGIMEILRAYLIEDSDTLLKNEIRLKTIGNIGLLPAPVVEILESVKEKTKACKKMQLILALSYGGRDDITRAMRRIGNQIACNKISADEVNEDLIAQNLDTREIPDPDLMIRPSGEMRISNFLLWQLSYSEIYLTKKHWPEFTKQDMQLALDDYKERQRRFGLTSGQIEATQNH